MVWALLQESVFLPPRPTNRQQLVNRVQEKWNEMTETYFQDLIESFPDRCKACIEAEGKNTKY